MKAFQKLLLLQLILMAFAGCVNPYKAPYGFVAMDRESFSHEMKRAVLPKGAPTISQGYKPTPGRPTTAGESNNSIHEGIDIHHYTGAPVLAAADGVVISSSYGALFGNRIEIAHGQGAGGAHFKTTYSHLQHRLVKEGATVNRGQQVGTLGMTGLLAANLPHLHFEIRTGEVQEQTTTRAVHPHKYWVDGKGMVTCFDIDREYSDSPFKTTYPVPCDGVRWKPWGQEQN